MVTDNAAVTKYGITQKKIMQSVVVFSPTGVLQEAHSIYYKAVKMGSEHVAHSVGPFNFTHGNAAPFSAPAGA